MLAWIPLCWWGAALHDGESSPGDREACLVLLDQLGQRRTFEDCRLAMQELTQARTAGWGKVARSREQVTLEVIDARRRSGGMACYWIRDLKEHLSGEAAAAISHVRTAFAGLMEPYWIERYLAERIEPLLEELDGLESLARILEPEAYSATFGETLWAAQ